MYQIYTSQRLRTLSKLRNSNVLSNTHLKPFHVTSGNEQVQKELPGWSTATGNSRKWKIAQKLFIPSIIEKQRANIGKIKLWGAAGLVSCLSAAVFGNLTYALAAIPIVYNYKSILIAFATLKRDLTFAQRFSRAYVIIKMLSMKDTTVFDCFEELAKQKGGDTMMIFEDTKWTYGQMETLCTKVINYFQRNGYEKGDVVALLTDNRPELVALILGLSKMGVIVAIFDPSCKGNLLEQSLKMSGCKSIVVSKDLMSDLRKLNVKPDIKIYELDGKSKTYENLNEKLKEALSDPIEIMYTVKQTDPLAYMFATEANSVKAAILTNQRFIKNVLNLIFVLNIKKCNIYNPLPMQQPVGLIAGLGPSIICGIPVIVNREFSTTKYLSDCEKYNCNVGLYTSEICFQLLRQPSLKKGQENPLKKMIGTGMPSSLWNQIKNRFNVDITELYGPTEENCRLLNPDGKPGAVGFIPSYLPKFLHPIAIIEVNPSTLEPIRDKRGLCIKSNTGRLIEVLNKKQKEKYLARDDHWSKNRIIENVFKKGDVAVITNDFVTMDKFGYLYFSDKLGEDLYIWKGEVVISSEVESAISKLTNSSCAVYGVNVPKTNEKGGMVLVQSDNLNFNTLAKEVRACLPECSCPIFIRVARTKGHRLSKSKAVYVSDGFNPTGTQDEFYYLNKNTDSYELINPEVYRKIIENEITF